MGIKHDVYYKLLALSKCYVIHCEVYYFRRSRKFDGLSEDEPLLKMTRKGVVSDVVTYTFDRHHYFFFFF